MDIQPEPENDESYCERPRGLKPIRVVFSPEAEEVYKFLVKSNSKIEKSILNAVRRKTEFITINAHYGEPVAKRLIPEEYKIKYGVTNLFWVELPNFWRMIYTLTNNEVEIIAFILDIFGHKRYGRKFGYH